MKKIHLPGKEELVCYCFGHTAQDIIADLEQHGASRILAEISAEKRAGNCQCASTNPKGR